MPLRLCSWLVSKGGIQDPAGDVLQMLGRHCDRPGLISKRGMSLDDAAHAAWEEGYFFGHERPSVNDLLDAIATDYQGKVPIYSEHDFLAVEKDRQAKAAVDDRDPALDLLARMVEAWRTHEGKRKRLRPLMREAERMLTA